MTDIAGRIDRDERTTGEFRAVPRGRERREHGLRVRGISAAERDAGRGVDDERGVAQRPLQRREGTAIDLGKRRGAERRFDAHVATRPGRVVTGAPRRIAGAVGRCDAQRPRTCSAGSRLLVDAGRETLEQNRDVEFAVHTERDDRGRLQLRFRERDAQRANRRGRRAAHHHRPLHFR